MKPTSAMPAAMIDWLRREPHAAPTIDLGDRQLPVTIRRLAQARRLTLRLAPDGSEARISMPTWARTEEALAFARGRADWLARQLAALPAPAPLEADGLLRYRGDALTIVHDPHAGRKPLLSDTAIRIGGPPETLPARLSRWLQSEALRLLADDLAHYCAAAGQTIPKLALSRAQRRWGSCAGDGTIRINWRLVMAPDGVRRSVVAHEVAHLAHFDHSPRFHAHLAALYEGDIDAANRWLQREGRGLYQAFG